MMATSQVRVGLFRSECNSNLQHQLQQQLANNKTAPLKNLVIFFRPSFTTWESALVFSRSNQLLAYQSGQNQALSKDFEIGVVLKQQKTTLVFSRSNQPLTYQYNQNRAVFNIFEIGLFQDGRKLLLSFPAKTSSQIINPIRYRLFTHNSGFVEYLYKCDTSRLYIYKLV